MLETYVLEIVKFLSKDTFEELISCVSKERKDKILRFRRFEDAQRSLLGDTLARYIICKRPGIKIRI